jgi:hypothetical protein
MDTKKMNRNSGRDSKKTTEKSRLKNKKDDPSDKFNNVERGKNGRLVAKEVDPKTGKTTNEKSTTTRVYRKKKLVFDYAAKVTKSEMDVPGVKIGFFIVGCYNNLVWLGRTPGELQDFKDEPIAPALKNHDVVTVGDLIKELISINSKREGGGETVSEPEKVQEEEVVEEEENENDEEEDNTETNPNTQLKKSFKVVETSMDSILKDCKKLEGSKRKIEDDSKSKRQKRE